MSPLFRHNSQHLNKQARPSQSNYWKLTSTHVPKFHWTRRKPNECPQQKYKTKPSTPTMGNINAQNQEKLNDPDQQKRRNNCVLWDYEAYTYAHTSDSLGEVVPPIQGQRLGQWRSSQAIFFNLCLCLPLPLEPSTGFHSNSKTQMNQSLGRAKNVNFNKNWANGWKGWRWRLLQKRSAGFCTSIWLFRACNEV